jgi:Viral BACON domain
MKIHPLWLSLVTFGLFGCNTSPPATPADSIISSNIVPITKTLFDPTINTTASSGPQIAPYTVIDVPYTVNTAEIQVPDGSTVGSGSDEQPFRDHGTVRVRYSASAMYTVGIYDSNGDLVAEDAVGAGKKTIYFDVANTARSHPIVGPFLDNSTSLFVYNNIQKCPDLGNLENIIRTEKRYVHTLETINLARTLNKCIVSLYRSKHQIIKPQTVLSNFDPLTTLVNLTQDKDTVTVTSRGLLNYEFYALEGEQVTPDQIAAIQNNQNELAAATDADFFYTPLKTLNAVIGGIVPRKATFKLPIPCKEYKIVICAFCRGGKDEPITNSVLLSNGTQFLDNLLALANISIPIKLNEKTAKTLEKLLSTSDNITTLSLLGTSLRDQKFLDAANYARDFVQKNIVAIVQIAGEAVGKSNIAENIVNAIEALDPITKFLDLPAQIGVLGYSAGYFGREITHQLSMATVSYGDPQLVLSGLPISAISKFVDTTTVSRTFNVQNTGCRDLKYSVQSSDPAVQVTSSSSSFTIPAVPIGSSPQPPVPLQVTVSCLRARPKSTLNLEVISNDPIPKTGWNESTLQGTKTVPVSVECIDGPKLRVNPLSATIDKTTPRVKINIFNDGNKNLEYSITPSVPWIKADPAGTPTSPITVVPNAKQQVSVTVDCAKVIGAIATAYLKIQSSGGVQSVILNVNCTGFPVPPLANFNPNPVALNALVNVVASAPLTVSNSGDDGFTVSAIGAVDLIGPVGTGTAGASLKALAVTGIGGGFGISPKITSIAGSSAKTITVTRLCPALPGKYTSTITLNGTDAVTDIPVSFTVPVELTCTQAVTPPPPPASPRLTNPSAILPDAPVSSTSTGSLTFTNSGGSSLTYSVASNSSWLQVTGTGSAAPAGGSGGATLVGTCPATEGMLSGSVAITSNDPLAPSTVVPVSLTCYAPYLVGPSPTPVTLTGKSGTSTDTQTLTVGNKSATRQLVYTPSISGTLTIATLNVSPALSANMTIGANGSQAFSLSANCLADKFGTESVTMNAVGANGAGSGSATINVTCKSPKFGPAPAGLSFTANAGETTAAQTFTVTNVGNDDLMYSTPPTVTSPAGAVSSLSVTGGTGVISAGKGQSLSVTATCSNALTAGQTDNFTITIYRADKPSDNVAVPVSVKCVSPIHIVVGSNKIIAFFDRAEAASSTSIAALDSAGNYADVNWTWTTPGVTAAPFFTGVFTDYNVRNPNGFYSGRVGTYMVKASLKSDPTVSAAALVTVVNRSYAGLAMGTINRVDVDYSGSGKINPPDLYPQRCAGTVHYQIATLVDGNYSLTLDNINYGGIVQLDVLYSNYEITWDRVIQDGACLNEIDEQQVQAKLSSLLTEVSNHWKANILPSVAFENPRIMFGGGCKTLWTVWNYSSGCYLVDLVPPPN